MMRVLFYLGQWSILCAVIGFSIGSSSALFLVLLDKATVIREHHLWLVAFLPLAGFAIGLAYHYWGKGVENGTNQLLNTIHKPEKPVPFKMAPLVLFGTLVSHLVGGSVGREGTAVQMGGSISDQLNLLFTFSESDRKWIMIAGISAGFSSVFGTPLAGAVFALEVYFIGRLQTNALLPALLAAILADYTTQEIWHLGHTHYAIELVPEMSPFNLLLATIAGICFGLTSRLYTVLHVAISKWFKESIAYAPFRPLLGGAMLVMVFFLLYYFLNTTKYMGLGVPSIVESFQHPLASYDFIIKLLLTAFTLGCGFKGGEVTPLFFIGATLGSTMSVILPLPTGLLAGMGFVAVFAGAANTPIACTLMAIELFGVECGVFVAIACTIAYLFSGQTGIYSSQQNKNAKNLFN